MAKSYRPVERDQSFLLPPDMRDWLPGDHVVWFVLDAVEVLDLSAFHARRRTGGVGAPGYDPRMMLGLLIYAYCQGVRSSRQIESRCVTDVAFRVACAQDVPDHATIARFRAQNESAFADVFTQVLLVAGSAGLVRLGTVAVDGTKIPANASIDANRSQEWLEEKVRQILAEAQSVDAVEDHNSAGPDAPDDGGDGQRMPPVLRDRTHRAVRIQQAAQEVREQKVRRQSIDADRERQALQRIARSQAGEPVRGRIPDGPHRLAEAQAHLARESALHQAKLDRHAGILAAGGRPVGRPPIPLERSTRIQRARRVVDAALAAQAALDARAALPAAPDKTKLPELTANTTDPASRIMPTRKGFLQGYNTQVAVSSDQVILAVTVTQSPNDLASLVPMMVAAQQAAAALHAVTGHDHHTIGTVLADAGYASDANLDAQGPDRLIALGKSRDLARSAAADPCDGPPPPDATPREAMAHRLKTPAGQALYKRRGATVEPAIGNLKKILDRFSRRGLTAVTSELQLAATTFNLMKIYRAAATT